MKYNSRKHQILGMNAELKYRNCSAAVAIAYKDGIFATIKDRK
ncbi:hypothetical protein SH580_00730 [Coraliomargarita algicola]|uniref:Uncharacterized protein n=1 Tax=Coraliomargarita algicola TaxID=3092156 RepID=A0ABZ0RJ45_9BACT|nr:hypothetical protein [Coraliomargarita sp. J2-16]WPJ96225.1 hypothetical protein SH580_00730 [Coraliomargarita sp. J2-16]